MSPDVEAVRAAIADAARVVVLTGAGMSAESGVPTFRGPSGLWRSYRPEELATPEAFARDPVTVWEWYLWRRATIDVCGPHDGHRALARWALVRGGVTLVTQNVDGLHHRAAAEVAGALGVRPDAALPVELHGAIHRDRCHRCGLRSPPARFDGGGVESLPRCTACAGPLRPDVVWFGEMLPQDALRRSFEDARRADVCVVVGTSAVVHPAASIPTATLAGGGRLVEVNTEATPLTRHAAYVLRGTAAVVLPAILGSPAGV